MREFIGSLFLLFAGWILWLSSARDRSLIQATATSKIATAAKGYVELSGVARPASAAPLRDPITDHPCLWFQVVTEKFKFFDKMRWREIARANSSRPFALDDGTGRCLLRPAEADIDRRNPALVVKERWNLRHKVWWIRDGQPIYALGHLERLPTEAEVAEQAQAEQRSRERSAERARERKIDERTAAVLRVWKQSRGHLMSQYDVDGDGRLDPKEWEAVRLAARSKASEQLGTALAPAPPRARSATPVAGAPGARTALTLGPEITHTLGPDPHRPLLISPFGERSLVKRRFWSSLGGMLMFLFGAIAMLALIADCTGLKR